MNSQPTRESCFRGRCSSQNNRCQSRKSPHFVLQPILVSQPQGGLCLRDANSSRVPALLHSPHPASPLLLCSTLIPSSTAFQAGLGDNLLQLWLWHKAEHPMHGKGASLCSCPAPTEGRSQAGAVCGSLHLAMLLVGALGAKLWLPAPCGHGKGFVPMGIPHLTLGMEPLGRGLSSGVLHSTLAGMGSQCFSPTAHTRQAVSWGQDLLWCVQTWVAEAGFVLCPHPHLFLAKGSGLP